MAWQLRGEANNNSTSTSVNVDVSGIGIQDGDWVVVVVGSDGSTVSTKTIDDSGWTAATEVAGGGCSGHGWHKVASTEPSSYTVSGLTNTNEHQVRVMVFYDDAGGTVTLDDADSNATPDTLQSTWTGPTITTSDNGRVVDVFANDSNLTITGNPTGTEVGTKLGTQIFLTSWSQNVSSGTHSNSITTSGSDGMVAFSFSAHFTPAVGGTPGNAWYHHRMNQ